MSGSIKKIKVQISDIFRDPDKNKDFQTYTMYILVLVWMSVGLLIGILGFLNFPNFKLRWLVFVLGLSLISIFNLHLNKLGYKKFASWSFVLMLWLIFTISCYTAGGINAPGILSQISIIFTAGFLLNWRGGLIIGLLSIMADFGFAYIETIGLLPQPTIVYNPLQKWISIFIPFGTILALQYFSTKHLRDLLIARNKDIKNKEETLEKLRESEERYKSIVSVSNTGAWEYNCITNQIAVSKEYYSMLGINKSDSDFSNHIQEVWINKLHPDDRDKAAKIFDDYIKNNLEGVYENYFRLKHENGKWVWIRSRAKRLRDLEENPTSIILGTHIDITEQVKSIKKIKKTEQSLQKLTSQIPGNSYIFEITEGGIPKVLFYNSGTHPYNFSYSKEDVYKHPEKLSDVLHEDDKEKFRTALEEAYQNESAINLQYRVLVDNQIRWRWFQAIPEKDKKNKVIWYGTANDVTDLIDYITSIEQAIFDIGHIIRKPLSSMKGITHFINQNDLTKTELIEVTCRLHQISEEMDKFIHELNFKYQEKRKSIKKFLDISTPIDNRDSLFK